MIPEPAAGPPGTGPLGTGPPDAGPPDSTPPPLAPHAPASEPAAPASGKRRTAAWLALALYLAVGAAGVWDTFGPTLASRFAAIQLPAPSDWLLLNYALEHEMRALIQPAYRGSLWSPPFFHPVKEVLAYTENLLGELPLYAVLRLGLDPFTAYQALAILLCLLDYAVMLLVLRRLGAPPALAAYGGYFLAFGMARFAQLGHPQLLAAFYAPLALLALVRLLQAPGRARLAWLLLWVYLQIATGFYLGWFLLLALAVLTPLLLALDAGARSRAAAFCRRSPAWIAGELLAWAAACYLTLRPYLRTAALLGYRSWGEALRFLPRVKSWWMPPFRSFYSHFLHPFHPWSPGVGEQFLFPGLVLPLLALIAAVHLLRLPREERPRQALPLACGAAAVILMALSVYLPHYALQGFHLVKKQPGVSLWHLVFDWVPGAQAIRAVARISTSIYILLLVAACVGAGEALRRSRLRPAARGALLGLLLAAGMAEQHMAPLGTSSKGSLMRQVERLRSRIPPRCESVYVAFSIPPGRYNAISQYMMEEIKAMWAGMEANVPVVNGYSGNYPPNYFRNAARVISPQELRRFVGSDPCVVPGEPPEP